MWLILSLSLALMTLAGWENYRHQRNLRRVPIRILVNGTRGKSSVVRLIAGALREAGYKTIAKTTGSDARIINEDGSEDPVPRPFGPRLTEQKALARLAVRRQADALVVECMALRPESQMVLQRHLVRSSICVITNVRVDHIEEIGSSIEETADALALTIPDDGTLVTTDKRFMKYGGRVVMVDSSVVTPNMLSRFPYPTFSENVALAIQVAKELDLDPEIALEGMAKALPDIGVQGLSTIEFPTFRVTLVSAFAANDVASTRMAWEDAVSQVPSDIPVVLLFNNRSDREYRIKDFLTLPHHIPRISLIATTGDYPRKTAKALSGLGLETLALNAGMGCGAMLEFLGKKTGGSLIVFGVGNFKGFGKELATFCMENRMENRSKNGKGRNA